MKQMKYCVIVALVGVMMLTTSCDDKAIPVKQLPAAAKTFVEKTYPGSTIVVAKKDWEWFSTEYKVNLDNGMEIKFDSDGLPLDVDMD